MCSAPHPQKPVWDSVDVERIRTACDPAASADLAVLLITASPCSLCSVGARLLVCVCVCVCVCLCVCVCVCAFMSPATQRPRRALPGRSLRCVELAGR